MWLIASSYKFCIKSGQQWAELLAFINGLIMSQSAEEHFSGVYMLNILNEEAAEQLKPHYINIFAIFAQILNNQENIKAAFYAIKCLKCIIPFTDEQELNQLVGLLPVAITVSARIIKMNLELGENSVSAMFDFFESLVEYDIPMITQYMKNLTELILSFVVDESLEKSTRVCALSFINVLIEVQKSTLLKNEMIRPIINTVFLIMCQSSDPLQTKSDNDIDLADEPEEAHFDETENLFTSATHVLDYCALYFPAKKFISILVEYVSPAATSDNYLHRRAALAALAITSEGCADFYRNHYMELLVNLSMKAMQDSNPQVVQLAYFALCQFSEFLQPNINQFAAKIMQLFIEAIECKVELRSVNRLTIRFYDALQSFCENLGDDLEPFLPTLMSKLMGLSVQCDASLKLKRFIICTFSSIVCSVKSAFNPYFDFAIQMIKPHLGYNQLEKKPDETKLLQIESIDLMGVFAKYMNKDKFNDALIENCLSFVQNILANDHDAEIRSGAYDLLAGLTSKLKENLPAKILLPHLLETLKSEEGINVIDSEEKNRDAFSALDEIDLLDNEDEDLEDEDLDDESEKESDSELNTLMGAEESQKMVIENEHIAEKLSAIYCLQEIAKYSNPQFIEFFNDCFNELKNQSLFPHTNVRKEAYLAMALMLAYYHDYCVLNLAKVSNAQKETIIKGDLKLIFFRKFSAKPETFFI
jgi:hypothetical protein